MDVAYDHIQEEVYPDDVEAKSRQGTGVEASLNTEFQEAYKAVANSPWGTRLGGLWGNVKKQSEIYYGEAAKEYTAASSTASKGIEHLISRTRSLSLTPSDQESGESSNTRTDRAVPTSAPIPVDPAAHPDRPESLSADIVKEASGIVARFRAEAAKRLKDVQKAEDAADEALLKFGTNISQFLREAVTIAPPTAEEVDSGRSKVLFESKDSEGKRVIHTTRFEAQLHVIHCSLDSFLSDPASDDYASWADTFDVDKHTEGIGKDLDSYQELRRAMEKCVPELVEYGIFWKRYYFLRHVIEAEEQRRRELLKGATSQIAEEVAWDEDSDDDANAATTPKKLSRSASTIQTPKKSDEKTVDDTATLKPAEPRRSHDQGSTAGSDASYDIVSGATSRTPGSPSTPATAEMPKVEESDEEDWE